MRWRSIAITLPGGRLRSDAGEAGCDRGDQAALIARRF
jgi:hypothetical protein